jgi:hypothetical protein
MGYYLHELHRRFDLDQHFDLPLSASEGLFAIPYRANEPGGIVAVTTHFLEFVPDDTPGLPALTADRLDIGATYRIVVTNSGGLYRYDMEDLVRVRAFYRRTPVIEFIAKADRRVSVANERLTELDVTVAMESASRATGHWFHHFLFVPCTDRRYRVLVDGAVEETGLQAFATVLEHRLRLASKGYDFERDDALLEALEVLVTAPGALAVPAAGTEAQRRLPNAQIKPTHLATRFDAHDSFPLVATYAAQRA